MKDQNNTKILTYTVFKNRIVLQFDVAFQRINYIKMERCDSQSHGPFDCEEMSIKYSRPKDILNVFLQPDCRELVILVTQVDNVDMHYAYTIKVPDNIDNTEETLNSTCNSELMARGFKKLFSGNNNKGETRGEMKNGFLCPIKNQNIFAKVTRK